MYREQYQSRINEAYIEALFFTDTEGDNRSSIECTLSDVALAKCNADCCAFVDELIEARLFKKALDVMTPEQIGVDFWFTRNGHGVGFWDRGRGALGDKLSEFAQSFGEVSVYQDGKFNIQVEGGKK